MTSAAATAAAMIQKASGGDGGSGGESTSGSSLARVNVLASCDLTGDSSDELVVGRDDGTIQVRPVQRAQELVAMSCLCTARHRQH